MSGNTNRDIWIAGATAAFTVDLLVYPLDTLKTRWQSPDYKRLFTDSATDVVNKRALFRGLYQGMGSVILATLPSSGAFFTTYEGIKSVLSEHNPTISGANHLLPQPLIHSVASSIAELVSCAILTPAEVIKQNAQMVDTSKGQQTSATLQTLAKFRSNPFALWRGYTALAIRNLPFTALQFPMFERLKEAIKQRRDNNGTRTNTILEGGLITAFSAGSAGSVAAVITTPVDVIKTRIMLSAADNSTGGQAESKPSPDKASAKASGVVDAMGKSIQAGKDGIRGAVDNVSKAAPAKGTLAIAKEVIRDQGVKGLFRGGALRAAWTMLGSGLYLGTYESGRVYLAKRNGDNIEEEDLL